MSYYLPRVQWNNVLVATSLAAFIACSPAIATAQSGTRQAGSPAKTEGSATKATKPAMEGYCPVCIIDMKKWVAGKAEFQSTFDSQTYLFPGQEQKASFDANPTKYVPVLAGDCVVALKKMNKRVPGSIRNAEFKNGRLFLFSNEMAKKEFLANQDAYANVDLALGGKCTVCKVEMQKDVEGKPEISVVYQGMRYYFPANEQREMFIANPGKYAVSKTAGPDSGSTTDGSSTKNDSDANAGGQGSSKK